jgi:hypothetical protein
VLLLVGSLPAPAQTADDWPPLPPPESPPATPGKEKEKEREEKPEEGERVPPGVDKFLPENNAPWGLSADLLDRLAERAEDYRNYARRFICLETIRQARYDNSGEASQERDSSYDYVLELGSQGTEFHESRERVKDGKKVDAKDNGPAFPPAYSWTALFSRFHQPYFAYRDLGDGFEGFDWVRAIEFKGSLPWSDGRDIRQWEGVAIINAGDMTLLEVRARPTGQRERIVALYKQWMQSFNLFGARLGDPPIGYRCRVSLLMRRDGLTFPTQLRYDTFRAVSPKDIVMKSASIREYSEYRFVVVKTHEKVQPPPGR